MEFRVLAGPVLFGIGRGRGGGVPPSQACTSHLTHAKQVPGVLPPQLKTQRSQDAEQERRECEALLALASRGGFGFLLGPTVVNAFA